MNEICRRILTGVISGVLFLGAYIYFPLIFSLFLIIILFIILFIEWPYLISPTLLKFWFITPIYPILPVLCLLYLQWSYRNIGGIIPLYPFLSAWIFDTSSYFSGRFLGYHKICPLISPKKSWEGLFGGGVGVLVLNFVLFKDEGILFVLSASVLLVGIAFLGDIFVSFLKRQAKIKDSGNILPGHGGLLDRFDSVFFVALAVVCYLFIIKLSLLLI